MNPMKALKPGWRMTPAQHRLFFSTLWPDARQAQGWDQLSSAERETRRHEVLSQLGFSSLKDVNHTDDFDTLKSRLMELADHVAIADPAEAGGRRRLLHRIGEAFAALDDAGYPVHSIQTILRNRFKVIDGVNTVTDLETHELTNLLRTISAWLSAWRKQKQTDRQPARAESVSANHFQQTCSQYAHRLPNRCRHRADTLQPYCRHAIAAACGHVL